MEETVKRRLSYTQIIFLGFLGVILVGTLLLCLPVATRTGEATPFVDAMYTAVSASCVTGLVVFDTYIHWSLFGQLVILVLIQVGGLGLMTVITTFSIFLKRRIGLHERRLLMQSAGSMRLGGVVLMIKRIAIGTLLFEGLGTIVLATRFCPEMGFGKGLYFALFHAVSAFCNAGFDLMGEKAAFSSLTAYAGDVVVNVTIMVLVVVGGIGFLVWNDVITHRRHFRQYQLHSKLVLITTGILILGGAVLFYLFEQSASFADLTPGQKVLAAFFQSVTPRTAGFNTVDLAQLSESGRVLTMLLMFVGGSPGSTAGGIKVTTLTVLLLSAVSAARHSPHTQAFKRRLDDTIVKQASAVAMLYLLAVLACTMIICALQPFSAKDVLFETISAAGTVGLATGITPLLGSLSKGLLMILMFGGRIGGLTLALALAEKRENVPLDRPVEKIMIG